MDELRDPQKLFRSEALAYLDRSADGRVLFIRPISHAALTLGILAFMAGLFVFTLWAHYRRSDLARGTLVFSGEQSEVYGEQAGVLKQLLVREGQQVEVGAPLFVVDASRFDLEGHRISDLAIEPLQTSLTVLESQKGVVASRYEADQSLLQQKIRRHKSSLTVHQALIQLTRQKVALLNENLKAAEKLLADDQISIAQVREERVALLDLRISLQRLLEDRIQKKSRLEELQAELQNAALRHTQGLQDIELRLANIQQTLVQFQTETTQTVKAPIRGVVANVTKTPGERVLPNQYVLMIVPTQSALEAEVYVAPKAIGWVAVGQDVRIQYDAFPYQKYGYAEGTIHEVSETTFSSREIRGATGVQGPFYRVRVRLTQQAIVHDDETQALRPGMTLLASILGEERSLFSWLFEPAIAVGKKLRQ